MASPARLSRAAPRPRLPRQADAGGRWTLRVRVTADGAAVRAVRLEGLAGGTRVAEALRLAAGALGLAAAAAEEAVVRSGADSRVLRGEETLAEAGAGAGGEVEVEVQAGMRGGGLWRFFGRMVGRNSATVTGWSGWPGDVVTGPGFSLHAQLGYPEPAVAVADEGIFAQQTDEEPVGAFGGLLKDIEAELSSLEGLEGLEARLKAASPAPVQVNVPSAPGRVRRVRGSPRRPPCVGVGWDGRHKQVGVRVGPRTACSLQPAARGAPHRLPFGGAALPQRGCGTPF
jgi:hypothetical protein